jgi:hypothetical protein
MISMGEDDDVLERACNQIWSEICGLLPHHRRLHQLGEARTEEETRELEWVLRRLAALRRRAERYRHVLRDEAWARYFAAERKDFG